VVRVLAGLYCRDSPFIACAPAQCDVECTLKVHQIKRPAFQIRARGVCCDTKQNDMPWEPLSRLRAEIDAFQLLLGGTRICTAGKMASGAHQLHMRVAIAPHSQNVDGQIEFDLARALHFIYSLA
jgi:hypothetical protein